MKIPEERSTRRTSEGRSTMKTEIAKRIVDPYPFFCSTVLGTSLIGQRTALRIRGQFIRVVDFKLKENLATKHSVMNLIPFYPSIIMVNAYENQAN